MRRLHFYRCTTASKTLITWVIHKVDNIKLKMTFYVLVVSE